MRTLVVVSGWRGTCAPRTGLLAAGERRLAGTLPRWQRPDFVRGRVTARMAMAEAAPAGGAGMEIHRAADGAPLPVGPGADVVLSLSHTEGYAAALVGPAGGRLGVDVEILDEGANAPVREALCAPDEPVLGATLTLACKEAAFKAFREPYRGLRHYRIDRDGRGLIVRSAASPGEVLRLWPVVLPGAVLVTATSRETPPDLLTVRIPSGNEESGP